MGLIQCKDVCKSFGEKVALDHVSVDIPKGKIFGLLGPNGAGKTTLIRIINRITIPNSGSVLFDGRPITQDDVEKIGYLPEERGLYRKMKVGDQAMYFAQLKGMSQREAARELKKWFVKFGIESWWNKKVEELSKGMAQKVQFITTVVHKPSLLILDEPTNDLDVETLRALENALLEFPGAAMVISHDRWFLDRNATHLLAVEGDSQVDFLAGTYMAVRKSSESKTPLGRPLNPVGNSSVISV